MANELLLLFATHVKPVGEIACTYKLDEFVVNEVNAAAKVSCIEKQLFGKGIVFVVATAPVVKRPWNNILAVL